MLKNAYFLAKIGADTAENEQHLAEILPIAWCRVLQVQGWERPVLPDVESARAVLVTLWGCWGGR